MSKSGKWFLALDKDAEFWDLADGFDTRQEAIKAGIDAVEEFNLNKDYDSIIDIFGSNNDEVDIITSFIVGQARIPWFPIFGYEFLESVAEKAHSEFGDIAHDYLYGVTMKEANILEERINLVLHEWMKEFNHLPDFYNIENVEKVSLAKGKKTKSNKYKVINPEGKILHKTHYLGDSFFTYEFLDEKDVENMPFKISDKTIFTKKEISELKIEYRDSSFFIKVEGEQTDENI